MPTTQPIETLVAKQPQVSDAFRAAVQLSFSRGDFQVLLRGDGRDPGSSDIADHYRGGREAR